MRVLMLIHQFWPQTEGGSERQCRALASALAAEGADVTVLTRWPGMSARRRETLDGARIRRVGLLAPVTNGARILRDLVKCRTTGTGTGTPSRAAPPRSFGFMVPFLWLDNLSFLCAAALYVLRRKHAVDVIHVHESHWIAGFGVWLGERAGRPAVVKEASFPVLMPVSITAPLRGKWSRERLRAPFIAQTAAAADALAEHGVSRERITVIPNGVAIPPQPADVGRNANVLYVGNLHQGAEWKGFDVLFEAWRLVMAQVPHARLVLAGSGDQAPWRQLTERLGIAGNIEFTGYLQDLGPSYATAALLVLPSRREGMSNALLEAMSWGIPAVVSDLPGNRAVVEHDRTGWLCPVGQPAGLAAGITALLTDPGRRARLGAAAREDVQRRFSLPGVAKQHLQRYAQLTESL